MATALLLALALPLPAAAAQPAPSPSPSAALSAVERQIEERLRSFQGTLGVVAVHLDSGETIAVNPDLRFPSASLIKVPVMVEVFHQIGQGKVSRDQLLTLTDEIKVGGSGVLHSLRGGGQYSVGDLLYLMTAISDNTAANMLIGLVGTRNVNERMVELGVPLTRLYRPSFRVGKADMYPEEEKVYGFGSTTPREMARLMERIARGTAVSARASEEMMALLKKQQDELLIPRRLPDSEEVVVASKTGAVTGVRNDAAVIVTPRARYVIAILTKDAADKRWRPDNEGLLAGADVSRIVFDHFDRQGAPAGASR